MGVIEGIDRFEGRCSLKTWMYRILINRARTRGAGVPDPAVLVAAAVDEPVVDPTRFLPEGHRWGGFWADPPTVECPEEQALAKEMRGILGSVLDRLPTRAHVSQLRDMQDFTAEEVCAAPRHR